MRQKLHEASIECSSVILWFYFVQVCRRSLHASVCYCAARGTTSAYICIFAKTTTRGMVDSVTESRDPKMIIAMILHACPSYIIYIRIIIRGYKNMVYRMCRRMEEMKEWAGSKYFTASTAVSALTHLQSSPWKHVHYVHCRSRRGHCAPRIKCLSLGAMVSGIESILRRCGKT